MAIATTGLSTHIWNNNLKSGMMVAFYPFVLIAICWAVVFILGFALSMPYGSEAEVSVAYSVGRGASLGNEVIAAYWPLIFGAAGIWLIVAYFLQARLIRLLSHARRITREEEPGLYNLVENLCISRGLALPKLEIIETEAMNAFASGIDDETYTIAVTRGLLNELRQDELEAVLAHELTHIMNGDVRLLIISIIFTGMVGFIAQLVWHSIRYNMFYGRGGGKKDGRIVLILLAIAAIVGIGYLATILTRFAISRKREYMADAGAIELTKNPDAMMRALLRISSNDHIPQAAGDISMMCTTNSSKILGLFTTHPPITARLETISAMTGVSIPEMDSLRTTQNPWQ